MKRNIVILLLTVLVITMLGVAYALAGEQGDAGQKIDDKFLTIDDKFLELDAKVQILEGNVSELDQRLQVLEAGELPPPTEPPPIEPPECIVTSVEPGQSALVEHRIPGLIEAEDFDICDSTPGCAAYYDTSVENVGLMYREVEGVDIKATGDVTGNFQVGWTNGRVVDEQLRTEWLEYTTCVEEGVYDVWLRVSAGAETPGRIKVTLGGQELGEVQVPTTGSWDSDYRTIVIPNATVEGGNKILRIEFTTDKPSDLNWIKFVRADVGDQGSILLAPNPRGVDENDPGAEVGVLSVPGEDCINYVVDDGRFIVVGDVLRLRDGISLDYEAEDLVSIAVTATPTECANP